MDRILFGDNQFLGINHQDPSKASREYERFSIADNIISVLGHAYEAGIRSFVFTTHPRFELTFKEISRSNLFPDLKMYPCVPYAHKYNDFLAVNTPSRVFFNQLLAMPFRRFIRLATNAVRFKIFQMADVFIDIEVELPFLPRLDGIFLQNVATDMALGLGIPDVLKHLHHHVSKFYDVELGFMTMNHALLVNTLVHAGIENPIVCSCINKVGFRMNPSKQVVEDSIASGISRNIAMSIMASGAIDPTEAIDYVSKLEGVSSILFGSSKRDHINSTVRTIANPK